MKLVIDDNNVIHLPGYSGCGKTGVTVTGSGSTVTCWKCIEKSARSVDR